MVQPAMEPILDEVILGIWLSLWFRKYVRCDQVATGRQLGHRSLMGITGPVAMTFTADDSDDSSYSALLHSLWLGTNSRLTPFIINKVLNRIDCAACDLTKRNR